MNTLQALDIAKDLITVPEGYELTFIREVKHDTDDIVWMRFNKQGKQDKWGGEHFSFTFSAQEKKLKGFMHLEDQFETDDVPNEVEAQEIAFDFLRKHAPDLVDTVEVRWIRPLRKVPVTPPHDEGFALASGKIITGMRVKLLINSNGKYGWVISGKNGHVITFERDIAWDTVNKCRATQRWLHDNWVMQQNLTFKNATLA